MSEVFALQLVYLFLPLVALAGGFVLILRGQYRAREGASRVAPASTVAAAAASAGFLLWGVAAIFGSRSSTAGLGFLFLPGQAMAVAAGAWLAVWSLLTLFCFVPAAGRWLVSARPGIPRAALALVLLAGGGSTAVDYGVRQARLEAAASPDSPPARLDAIAGEAMREMNLKILIKLAGNAAAGPTLLAKIRTHCEALPKTPGTSRCYSVNAAMAGNAAAGGEILAALAKDPAHTVRAAVGYNAQTPAAVLDALSRDAEPQVRIAVTTNKALPRATLERLAQDPVPRVRARAEAMLKQRGAR